MQTRSRPSRNSATLMTAVTQIFLARRNGYRSNSALSTVSNIPNYTRAQHTNFLHLFAFLVSRPPQSTLLHCQAPTLLLNRWLVCLTGFSILVLKLTFSPDPFPRKPSSLSNGLISRFLSSTFLRKSLALKTLVSAAD